MPSMRTTSSAAELGLGESHVGANREAVGALVNEGILTAVKPLEVVFVLVSCCGGGGGGGGILERSASFERYGASSAGAPPYRHLASVTDASTGAGDGATPISSPAVAGVIGATRAGEEVEASRCSCSAARRRFAAGTSFVRVTLAAAWVVFRTTSPLAGKPARKLNRLARLIMFAPFCNCIGF